MAIKRKEGESSKPSSTNTSAAKPISKTAGATSGDEESSAKKPKFVKDDPGMTAKEFEAAAKNIPFSLGEGGKIAELLAEPTTFSTGSFGWKTSGKTRIKVTVDGQEKEVSVQIGLNLTVSGSKPDGKKATNGKRGRPRKNPAADGIED